MFTEELAKALKETTVNGLFNDLMYFLLTSIFNMQEQEENEEEQDLSSGDTNMKSRSTPHSGLVNIKNYAACLLKVGTFACGHACLKQHVTFKIGRNISYLNN